MTQKYTNVSREAESVNPHVRLLSSSMFFKLVLVGAVGLGWLLPWWLVRGAGRLVPELGLGLAIGSAAVLLSSRRKNRRGLRACA